METDRDEDVQAILKGIRKQAIRLAKPRCSIKRLQTRDVTPSRLTTRIAQKQTYDQSITQGGQTKERRRKTTARLQATPEQKPGQACRKNEKVLTSKYIPRKEVKGKKKWQQPKRRETSPSLSVSITFLALQLYLTALSRFSQTDGERERLSSELV